MSINLDGLSEQELTALHHRIVERLNALRAGRVRNDMLQFRLGERVAFQGAAGAVVVGTLIRHNRKSVTIVATDGRRWNVSPSLLRAVVDGNGKPQHA